jgi:hypothetical protein
MLSLSKPCPGLDPGTKGEGAGRGTLDPRDKPEDDSIHDCHPAEGSCGHLMVRPSTSSWFDKLTMRLDP